MKNKALAAIPSLALPLLLAAALVSCEGCVIRIETSGGKKESWSQSLAISKKSATATQEIALEIASGEVLALDSSYGSVECSVSESGFRVVGELTASADSRDEAEAALQHVKLRTERSGSRVRVVIEKEETAEIDMDEIGVTASYKAFVPAGVSVEAKTGSGSISAEGPLSSAKLSTSYGEIRARGTRGEVSATSGSGKIELSDIEGPRVEGKTSYGSVSASGIDAEEVRLHSSSGGISAEKVEAKTISIGSSYGSVKIEGVLEAVTAKSSSGSVAVRALAGSRAGSAWNLSSGYGEVSLSLPANFSCEIDAQTGYGSVQSDFPITLPAGHDTSKGRLAGAIGSGGAKVSLKTSSGRIRILKN